MTKAKIKEKLYEYVLLECEVEDICNFLSDMFDELVRETEAKEPHATNTIQKYRTAAEEIADMAILLTDILEKDSIEQDCLGTIVEWEGERWYVDNTDENFKDEEEETSLFLLPEKYADAEENDRLYCSGDPDSIGFWVHKSLVSPLQ